MSRRTLVTYERSSGIYFIGAAGGNIWGERDAFGFLWKEIKGDIAISARVRFVSSGGHAHRKAGIMLRQSLAPDSVYVDAVSHGDGLTSLQYRARTGGPTREIQCLQQPPAALRLVKRGDYVQLFTADESGAFGATGCLVKVALGGKFLAGLAVCAHDNQAFENARFNGVMLGPPPEHRAVRISSIQVVNVDSLARRVFWYSSARLEVPSFTAKGDAVCFRQDGELKLLRLDGNSEPQAVGAENLADCETAQKLISAGRHLAQRVDGGRAQIWLETADGKARALTHDRNNWLPRIAPDASSFAYLSGTARAEDGRPGAGDYLLLQKPLDGGEERELAWFPGGAGSLGISPWSADGKRVVFVTREPG